MLQAVSAVQSGGSPTSDVQEVLAAASSPVLRIIIDNMFYPVTLDVLQQVTVTLTPSRNGSVGVLWIIHVHAADCQHLCFLCFIGRFSPSSAQS